MSNRAQPTSISNRAQQPTLTFDGSNRASGVLNRNEPFPPAPVDPRVQLDQRALSVNSRGDILGLSNLKIGSGDVDEDLTISYAGSSQRQYFVPEVGPASGFLMTRGDQQLAGPKTFQSAIQGSVEGTAASAGRLTSARAINGRPFDGSAAVTTPLWGEPRTFQVGDAAPRSVDGGANVTWTLAELGAASAVEIGAVSAALAAKYDRAGGTISGNVDVSGNLVIRGATATVTAQSLAVEDAVVVVNQPLDASGNPLADALLPDPVAFTSGMQVHRGPAVLNGPVRPPFQFLFAEASETFRIGEQGGSPGLQAVATREESQQAADRGVFIWSAGASRLESSQHGVAVDGSGNVGGVGSLSLLGGLSLAYPGSAARTYGFPEAGGPADVGAPSAEVVLTEGAQQVSGTKTFSSPIAADVSGNAATVTLLAGGGAAIGVSGAATGTPQPFDGGAGITIPVTDLDASSLASGTVAAGRLGGSAVPYEISVTGNAGSAAALQTARQLWGRPFSGGASVSGTLSGVGGIAGAGPITISAGGGVGPSSLTLRSATEVSFPRGLRFSNGTRGVQLGGLAALTADRTLAVAAGGDTALAAGTMVPAARTLEIGTGAAGSGLAGGAAAADLGADRSWTVGLSGKALALHELSGAGLVSRSGDVAEASGVAARGIAVSGDGVSITNADGAAGNPTITLAAGDSDVLYSPNAPAVASTGNFAGRYVHGQVTLNDGSIVIWGGLGASTNVSRSTDLGATWTTNWGTSPDRTRFAYAVDPSDGSIYMAGGRIAFGNATNVVNRSTNGGVSWTTPGSLPANRTSMPMVVWPGSPSTLVVMGGSTPSATNDVLRSSNGGVTWTAVATTPGWSVRRSHQAVLWRDAQGSPWIVLMGGGFTTYLNDVWRSNDAGGTWTQVVANAPWAAREDFASTVVPRPGKADVIVIYGGFADVNLSDIWISENGGFNWTQITPSVSLGGRYAHTMSTVVAAADRTAYAISTAGITNTLTADVGRISVLKTSTWTSAGANIFNTNAGNVGIGTTSPIAKLDVSGDIKEGLTLLKNKFASRKRYIQPQNSVVTWTPRTAANTNGWQSITWAAELGLFCAVADIGGSASNRVMTSPDGITWTPRTAANTNAWSSVTWSAELGIFCAVAYDFGDKVMTSPDGITWTARTAGVNNNGWISVTWSAELGIFCAVAYDGGTASNRVMTSPDGITWTPRAAANTNWWVSVTWAAELGLFCAVAHFEGNASNRIMTSPNGITWTPRAAPIANAWRSVTWAADLGLFCVVADSGGDQSNRIMTSPDGITWTARAAPVASSWRSVIWAAELGLFCTVAFIASSNANYVMTSPDGITWTPRTVPHGNQWRSVTWSAELGIFCAVANNGGDASNRVMTSTFTVPLRTEGNNTITNGSSNFGIGIVPTQRLHVDGSVVATAFQTTSDGRLKTDAQPIVGALAAVMKLAPQKYVKVARLGAGPQDGGFVESGLIAQRVWYDAPELRHLVTVAGDATGLEEAELEQAEAHSWGTTPAAMNYNGLVAYLVATLQEQQARLAHLRDRLDLALRR